MRDPRLGGALAALALPLAASMAHRRPSMSPRKMRRLFPSDQEETPRLTKRLRGTALSISARTPGSDRAATASSC